jgi:hypothetical protein
MNIYLIKAKQGTGYDSYDGHVVVAYTEHDARRNVPHGDEVGWANGDKCPDFWTDDAHSSCEQIGTVLPDREHSTGAILSSFNAG